MLASGRFIMAFDCTYLQPTLSQMKLNGTHGMVGGCWSPQNPGNSILPLDDTFDISSVSKSSNMMEMLVWEPGALQKHALSVCSLPTEHAFEGALASYRGSLYVLQTVGSVLQHNQGTVRGLAFDNHGSHLLLRNVLFGQVSDVCPEDLKEIPFFSSLDYKNLPNHDLPRLPAKICLSEGECFWPLGGICTLAILGFPWLLPCSCLKLFYVVFICFHNMFSFFQGLQDMLTSFASLYNIHQYTVIFYCTCTYISSEYISDHQCIYIECISLVQA